MKHQEIIELLPWYVNGTLSQPERQAIKQHLDGDCGECAREIKSLTAMRKAVVAQGNETPEPSPFLMNRALAQIEDYERSRPLSETKKPVQFRERMKAFREAWWPKTPVFARVALAAQLAVVLVLASATLYQYENPKTVYRTLGGPSAPGTGAKISVMFNEGASEREIRQALSEINGQIVAGPSAQGLYTVQVSVAPDKPEELDRLLQKLRQNQRVIRFAERTE